MEPIARVLRLLSVPIILSLFLYYALRPIVRKLNDKKINKGITAFLTILMTLFSLMVMIVYGFTVIKDQFQNSFIINLDQLVNYTNIIDSGLG
ncbi:MAG: AI-2E family transporter, partial [Flavobacteriales bacterium]|nr:AI-2E family transporter [Flavobacteriales bacterium]